MLSCDIFTLVLGPAPLNTFTFRFHGLKITLLVPHAGLTASTCVHQPLHVLARLHHHRLLLLLLLLLRL